jgi:hypothetical protein
LDTLGDVAYALVSAFIAAIVLASSPASAFAIKSSSNDDDDEDEDDNADASRRRRGAVRRAPRREFASTTLYRCAARDGVVDNDAIVVDIVTHKTTATDVTPRRRC